MASEYIDPDLEDEFNRESSIMRNEFIPPMPLSNETLLELYGLYKQASEGDCNEPTPGMFSFKAQAKHNAWMQNGGLTKCKQWSYTLKKPNQFEIHTFNVPYLSWSGRL